MDLSIKDLPTTRYQGSKRKIVPWIYDSLRRHNIQFDSVLDAFGGTSTVSYMFKKMGKKVTYNDSLKFNHTIGKALIENNNVTLTDEEVDKVLAHHSNNTFIQDTFQGIYFLPQENVWLDNTIGGIEEISGSDKDVVYKKAIAYYALFQACMIKRPFNLFHRNNLYIRTQDVERNFGNKTTWEQPFDVVYRRFVTEANRFVFKGAKRCRSINKSAFSINPRGYDLVYLDPPYYSQNGSHETAKYDRCYHFLEGISNYDIWESLIDYDSHNLRLRDTKDSFLNKEIFSNDDLNNIIYDRFDELIYRYRNSILVLSYKNGGKPGIKTIVKMMSKYKERVFQVSRQYSYALNKSNNEGINREVLIIGL